MKRLTKKIGKHYTFHDCDIICDKCFGGCKVSQRTMDKYGELEDLLEGELGTVDLELTKSVFDEWHSYLQFAGKRNAFERMLGDVAGDKVDWERLRELIEADRERRIVVLPCSVGSEYYTVDKFCTEDGYYAKPTIHTLNDCYGCDCRCDKEWRVVKHVFWAASSILMLQESIGKGIFLSLEEAEKKKAELEKGNE